MNTVNESAWNEYVSLNQDAYGGEVIQYAERWANLMESKIAQGESLEDVWWELSQIADVNQITGFMFGAAVQVLFQVWERGDALRILHNKWLGQEDEGVLNPALLVLDDDIRVEFPNVPAPDFSEER